MNQILENQKLLQLILSKLSNLVENAVVKRTEYNAKIKNIKDKMSDVTNLATKTTLNAKINEVKGAIPNLATTTALTAVENKIPDVSSLVKKAEFNRLTAEHFAARLKQANLVTKTDFDDNLKNFNKKNYFKQKETCSC